MKVRIAIFVCVVAAAVTANAVFDTVIHPTVSAELAVSQLNDEELPAVTMRGYDRLANTVPVALSVVVSAIGLALFAGPVITNLKKETQ